MQVSWFYILQKLLGKGIALYLVLCTLQWCIRTCTFLAVFLNLLTSALCLYLGLLLLALCFGLGAIHLVAGMVVKIYMLLRDGDVMGAVCDQISWLIMFLGFFLMALVPGPVGKYLAWLGAGIIVLFGGREKKGIVNRLLGGLLTLYNISGYLSDLLSYSRISALGLATGVIAMVINTVAQMLWSAGPVGIVAAILVLLAGHYFNIIINVLGAFVHSSRLQYIEFFGKFYEAGGRAFLPLALRTKYTDITK